MNKDWVGDTHSVRVCLGAGGKEPREEHDYYATDPVAAEWLLRIEKLSTAIWEPACGEGHLSKVFAQHGHIVKSTDLIDRGYGLGGVDFLQTNVTWHGDIVTNPPYKYAEEFIRKALETVTDGHKVCMFLKVQFLEGKERKNLFLTMPPKTVWVSSSRINCGKNGDISQKSAVAYCWFVWEKGYAGITELRWFN